MPVLKSQEIIDNLSDSGFQVIVYGREDDPEVQDLVDHANGMALQDPEKAITLRTRKVAVVRQTSEERDSFADFVSRFFAHNIAHIYELRVISTPAVHGRARLRNGG